MNDEHHELAHELRALNDTLKSGFEWFRSHAQLATKDDLKHLGDKIMSKISDYVTAVEAQLDGIGQNVDGLVTAIGGINTSLTGISGDVTELKRIITDLNNNPGPITPADQALLDESLTRLGALSTKAQAAKDAAQTAADAAKVLDDATAAPPPTPPTA